MSIKGVITGDIIASSSLPAACRRDLLEIMQHIASELKQICEFEIAFFRGDSFQLLVQQPEKTMLLAILFRAGLAFLNLVSIRFGLPAASNTKRRDARLAIGVGSVAFVADSITISDGEAFQLSGRTLDSLKKRKLAVSTPWKHVNEELAVSTAFADDIVSKWTPTQAQAIYHTLLYNLSQKELAEKFRKTPQTINKLLGDAKESLIKAFLERYQNLMLNAIAS